MLAWAISQDMLCKRKMDDILEALCCCTLFKDLDKADIENAISTVGFQIKEYEKGEFICREDQSSDQIGIVISGGIEIQKNLSSGNIYCLFYENTGDMFGGCIAFSSNVTYPCDVYSSKKSKIVFLQKYSFFKLFSNTKITENMMFIVSKKIFYFENRLELFSYSSIQKKIAYYLLNNISKNNSSTVYLPFTKKQWAEYMNVSRPSLFRELKKLNCCNVIEIDKDKITVLDEKHLASLLS